MPDRRRRKRYGIGNARSQDASTAYDPLGRVRRVREGSAPHPPPASTERLRSVMNVSLFPLPEGEAAAGFDTVVARFHDLEERSEDDPSAPLCDLGEDGDVLRQVLERADFKDLAGLMISGGRPVGDDGVGTVCLSLAPDEVTRVDGTLSGIDLDDVMRAAPAVLSPMFRAGGIPEGYEDGLRDCLEELRAVYRLAAGRGLAVAQVFQG